VTQGKIFNSQTGSRRSGSSSQASATASAKDSGSVHRNAKEREKVCFDIHCSVPQYWFYNTNYQ
jgi:hypothetical protein